LDKAPFLNFPATPAGFAASAEKAIREPGWKPKFPKREDIVETAWARHKKQPAGYLGLTRT
jgi:UDP-glucose 4-epimerase